jgi:hypothetical protein
MKSIVIEPSHFPLEDNETWFVVNPNNAECTFHVPDNSQCVCIKDFLCFVTGTLYTVVSHENGWLTVSSMETIIKMPEYLYARHFDAETYVKNRNSYQKPNQLLFQD